MTDVAKRSAILAEFDTAGFEIGEVNATRIAIATRTPINDAGFIADVSAVRKTMIAGPAARHALESYGIEAPQELLRWRPLGADGAVAYLHHNRFLVVEPTQSSEWTKLFDELAGQQGDALVLHHEAADFALGGQAASAAISELCFMNVADTADDVWIMTRLANCEIMLRRVGRGRVDYRLMCTPADAAFLFGVLADVIVEHDGGLAGFNDYLGLLQRGATA